MGLDMYLSRTKKGFNKKAYDKAIEKLSYEEYPAYKEAHKEEVGYWRKANQVHSWFVTNVQNGIDKCQEVKVPKEKLQQLYDICNKLLQYHADPTQSVKEIAMKELPPQSGFFFGNTNIDEWYWQDIEMTHEILETVLKYTDFNEQEIWYRASW